MSLTAQKFRGTRDSARLRAEGFTRSLPDGLSGCPAVRLSERGSQRPNKATKRPVTVAAIRLSGCPAVRLSGPREPKPPSNLLKARVTVAAIRLSGCPAVRLSVRASGLEDGRLRPTDGRERSET